MKYSGNPWEEQQELSADFILFILMFNGDIGRNIQISPIYLPNKFFGFEKVGTSLDAARIEEQVATPEKKGVLVRDK